MKHRPLFSSIVVILLISSCTVSHTPGEPFLQSSESDETSGVIASQQHKRILYIHNDSGDVSRFFAINESGKLVSTCYYKSDEDGGSSGAVDCEDIAMGPGPVHGKNYIYVGDIGDNRAIRPFITVYRIPEPAHFEPIMHPESEAVRFKYPDGPRDAETLLVDPLNKQLLIISKREDSVGIYTAPLVPPAHAGTILLVKKGSLHFPGNGTYKWITAGDIAHDGSQVLIRSYEKVFHWNRIGNEPVEQTLQRAPQEIKCAPEPQGEAICFSADDRGLFSLSEGVHANIHYKKLPAAVLLK